ncbi:DExH-box splicing factor binding site-domain-containing protein [Mycena belliarum]|uniref:DExH-box splicing factor binding site-domain-containing protein n=1 Tax=Mycena belliarum TaxID=1033014 RepID=A0AAD6XH67_9AGAR|nr:DExH-box splicing factor binding site-domain-containing protein [Mycena belliae]
MSKVSFTIRRPTPVSRDASSGPESDSSFKVPALPRHLTQDSAPGSPLSRSRTSSPPAGYNDPDSSDEDEGLQDELVSSFDAMGAQRLHKSKKAPQGPLVIPALKNRDWRELARKRRSAAQFVPESARAATGKDGSVGGLGVRDSINSGPVLSGLQVRAKVKDEEGDVEMVEEQAVEIDVKQEEEETEDQRALRAILAGADGASFQSAIDVIPTLVSEDDAYKQDVEELPDVATLEDYDRVPVAQFGLALLRGMGWKEGTAASRKPGKGLIQPYLPEARPALLGIGAKEREVLDDGSNKKSNGNKRPERRYIPVVKQDREGGSSSGRGESSRDDRARSPRRDNGSTSVSRRGSRSRSPMRRSGNDERRRDLSRRETSYDDRPRESSRRDDYRKDSSRRDYDRRDTSDRYSSNSRRRD